MARIDGRAADALRITRITTGVLDYAEGSAMIEVGATRVLCAASVEEAQPPHLKGTEEGWITAEYAMLPRSTHTRKQRDSTRGRIDGRTHEIQRLIGRSLRAAIDLSRLGARTIYVDCDVIQADGGTRTAAITGGYVALAIAVEGVMRKRRLNRSPLVTQVASVSAGIVGGDPVLDLSYEEDSRADLDFNVVMTAAGEFIEVQGTAERRPFDRTGLNHILDLAEGGLRTLFQMQRDAIDSARPG